MFRSFFLMCCAGWLGIVIPADTLSARDDFGAGCYDAKVKAKVVDQLPSPFPETDDGSIILSWPWFVDLNIKRVVEGDISDKQLEALAVLHTYYVRNKTLTFYLRKNTADGYNILRGIEKGELGLCSSSASKMKAYIRPRDGQSYKQMRAESKKAWLNEE